VEIRPPFAGFPSPVERVGNSLFEFSMLSHGVAFPPRPLGAFGAQRRGLFLATPFLAHRLAAHLDTVGIVHQPVENAVGERRIADLLVLTWPPGVGWSRLSGAARQTTKTRTERLCWPPHYGFSFWPWHSGCWHWHVSSTMPFALAQLSLQYSFPSAG